MCSSDLLKRKSLAAYLKLHLIVCIASMAGVPPVPTPDTQFVGPPQKGRGVQGQYMYAIAMSQPTPEVLQRGVKQPSDFDRVSFRELLVQCHVECDVAVIETACFRESHANGVFHLHSKAPLLRVGGALGPVLLKSNNHQPKVSKSASHCSGSIVLGRVLVRVLVVLKRNKVSFPLKNNKNPNKNPTRNYAPTTVGSTF